MRVKLGEAKAGSGVDVIDSAFVEATDLWSSGFNENLQDGVDTSHIYL